MGPEDINFALVEEPRPPLYTAMKYWGKKPHNIWRAYIERYTAEGGLFLDPFAGSAISAFEAVKANRKAICFDLNPMTSFTVECLGSTFNEAQFSDRALSIIDEVSQDLTYQELYSTICPSCGKKAVAQNFKWDGDSLYEIGVECFECVGKKDKVLENKRRWNGIHSRYLAKPTTDDQKLAKASEDLQIPYWFPTREFPNSPSFSANFVRCMGGNRFSNLWSRRNLFVLSKLFDLISSVDEKELRLQLLFAFTQTIHLCTKMSVPRREKANRMFSTSWGRSAYICSKRKMEMNPLLVFEGNCFGRQSAASALRSNHEYLGKRPKLLYVDKGNKSNRSKNYDIKYGIVDVSSLEDYVDEGSIDFIMTDPPYGGLVQYLDLSSIWLVWLEHLDERFKPIYEAEITIKHGHQGVSSYERKFQNGVKQLYKALKTDGKIVFTFHNKDLAVWNMFLKAISLAGFKVEKVIHQQNRRTGESNVANPYGTSGSDLYIRCSKAPVTELRTDADEFEHFVVTKAIELISLRNEPTPFQILFNGLLVEISSAGFDLVDFDNNIEGVLSKHLGGIFKITTNHDSNAGNYWWFEQPDAYIKYRDKGLSERVEESVVAILRRRGSVTFDEVLGDIFVRYPNGLTPDQVSIGKILSGHAYKSGGRWVYRGDLFDPSFTKHTDVIYKLNFLGMKLNYETYIGKREQSELHESGKLSDYSTHKSLEHLDGYDQEQLNRIEMIDLLWLVENEIRYVVEVENSTGFTSGIQRGSNVDDSVPKIMVLPNERKNEFEKIQDPLFREYFAKGNWRYLFYDDVEKLFQLRELSISDLDSYLKELN